MRETIWRQPADLRSLLADPGPVEAVAPRLAGKRLLVVGTGTSWHPANHGAWLLREAGVETWPLQAMDAALYGLPLREGHAVLVMSHRNTKRFSSEVLDQLRRKDAGPVQVVGGRLRGDAVRDRGAVVERRPDDPGQDDPAGQQRRLPGKAAVPQPPRTTSSDW